MIVVDGQPTAGCIGLGSFADRAARRPGVTARPRCRQRRGHGVGVASAGVVGHSLVVILLPFELSCRLPVETFLGLAARRLPGRRAEKKGVWPLRREQSRVKWPAYARASRAAQTVNSGCRNRAIVGTRLLPRSVIGPAAPSHEALHVAPSPPRGPLSISPSRPEFRRRMSRKKIGMLAVAAVLVAAAAVAGGTDLGVEAVVAHTDPDRVGLRVAVALDCADHVTHHGHNAFAGADPCPLAGTVVEVVDGDTIRVELPSGIETVRIIGIDTPEVVHPTEPEACFGNEASAFAHDTLDGQAVTLELDPTQDERDRYDRLLAHVHVGDTLYAAEAIAAGYGIHYVYERPSIHAAELDAAADTAREAGLGIWASCEGRVDLPVSRSSSRRPSTSPIPSRPPTPTATPPTSRASRTPATTSTAATSASRSRSSAPTSTASTRDQRRRRLRELLMKRYTHCDCRSLHVLRSAASSHRTA